eukprot:10506342-Karenia_brevis.AAC.1
MEGRQTVPRSDMAAVMRALLAVEQYGQHVTSVTIWSDRKIVVQGYCKPKTRTLKTLLVTGWEEIWDRAEAIITRGTTVAIKRVKAHTTDEAIASREQQAGKWLSDSFADKGAQALSANYRLVRPILKKDR